MKQTAVEWLIDESMKLVVQYMQGTLNEDTLDDVIYEIGTKAKAMEKEQKILLVEQLKDYTKESQCILGNDEREASEFVDIFYQKYFKSEQDDILQN